MVYVNYLGRRPVSKYMKVTNTNRFPAPELQGYLDFRLVDRNGTEVHILVRAPWLLTGSNLNLTGQPLGDRLESYSNAGRLSTTLNHEHQ